jgi:NADH dehydrogenase
MILVTGAAGFVGRTLIERLLSQGAKVRGLDLPGRAAPLSHPALSWQTGDVTDRSSLEPAFAGIDTVVHFAAVVANPDEAVNQAVNIEGTRTLVQLCRVNGVRRFVFMSAAAAKFVSKNAYGRSKRQAEEIVAASGLEHAIVRTPLIIGRGGEEWNRFVDFVGKLPGVVPVFGDGTAIKRPVYIDDVVDGLANLLARPALGDRIWEIACREPVSLDGLIDATLAKLGLPKRKLHIPLPVSLGLAGLAEAILGHRSPVTRDIILGLNENVDFDVEDSLATLGISPRTVEEAIAASL